MTSEETKRITLTDEETGAPTLRDPHGVSPAAASVASPHRPDVDAGAWALFATDEDHVPTLRTMPIAPLPPTPPPGARIATHTLPSEGVHSARLLQISGSDIAVLEVFARITAAVRADGATERTLARFGLDAATWLETEQTFAERFAKSPSLARAFATMLSRIS